jgi:Trehalase
MIPHDDFTPHGYLDNPYHAWKLNPSGVLRSLAPLGMGWHVPNLGTYVRNQFQYTAHLTIGLKIGQQVMVTPEDFQRHGCSITSQLHTRHRFEYTCLIPQYGLTLTARYFLVAEHTLGCVLVLKTTRPQPIPITCYLIHCHTHNPFTSRLWEHGLYARQEPGSSYVMLGLASEGDVFMHGVRAADGGPLEIGTMGYTISLEEIARWAVGEEVERPHITQRQEENGWQVRTLALPCSLTLVDGQERILNVILARGVSQDQANQHWQDGIEEIALAEAEHRADDEAFWERTPQLSGDWPAHWRRGWVYDQETVRMTIRPPIGVIGSFWDGMQIQAPRTVLAEAAMDVLFLSYADPSLAAEVILGLFESSPHAQLPCMREDGSYNMVADDGQLCGTAPEWGFPLWCCDQIFRRTGDVHWLHQLYPKAAAYLRWWLRYRTDAEGWLVYACSWESGQDVSSRFGPQQTGGSIIQHVRPVDLQASMVQAGKIMAHWATLLADAREIENDASYFTVEAKEWQEVARNFTIKTQLMWQDDWFRDYDAVAGEWSTQQDAMHLAPIFCGASDWGHVEQLREALAHPPTHSSGWAPLSWPPVVMTLVGAASAASMPAEATELAYRYIDDSYRSTDSRQPDEEGGLPGVTREYRRVIGVEDDGTYTYGNGGIEGYGWGALSIHLLLRYLLGMREEEAGIVTVSPMLPQALRRSGSVYRVEPIQWGIYTLGIECRVEDAKGYTVRLNCTKQEKVTEDTSLPLHTFAYEWQGVWGEERKLSLPQLLPTGRML